MAGPPRAIQELLMRIFPTFGPFTNKFWPVFQNQLSQSNPILPVIELCDHLERDAEFFHQESEEKRSLQCLYSLLDVIHTFKHIFDLDELFGPENLSKIYFKCAHREDILGSYQASFKNANKCIELAPHNADGYVLAVTVKAKEKDYLTAALYTFRMIRDAETELPFAISQKILVVKLASFLTNITDPADWKKFKFFTQCPQHFTLSTEEWREILHDLYNGDQFQSFSLLTTGNCGVPFEPQTYIHKLADVPGMRYQWADVGYVVKHLKGKE
ncbi:hypothetical protein PoB_002685900, partial [Plakobranchus ocellatus]